MTVVVNILVAACIIGFTSWLSGKSPTLAGFIAALPLSTMLILPMSQLQYGNTQNTFLVARSIFLAVPIALVFFIPFLFANKWALGFWQAYGLGCLALGGGFLFHRVVGRFFGQLLQ